MIQNYLSLISFFLLGMSVGAGLSSSSFFMFWLSLELNLICFVFLLTFSKGLASSVLSMKYFVTQSLFSVAMLFFFLFSATVGGEMTSHFFLSLVFLAKLGVAPFHSWFLSISVDTPFNIMLWFFTVQKMLPLYALHLLQFESIFWFILLSAVFALLGTFSQLVIKLLLGFSSIFSLAWMLAGVVNLPLVFFFLALYGLNLFPLLLGLNYLMLLNIKLFLKQNSSGSSGLVFFLAMVSLGGLPPTLGFLSKALLLQFFLEQQESLLAFMLTISSVFLLFMYLRLCYMSLLGVMTELLGGKLFTSFSGGSAFLILSPLSLLAFLCFSVSHKKFWTSKINLFWNT